MRFTKKLGVVALFMSCISSSIYGAGESDFSLWAKWFYRRVLFAEDWVPSTVSEKDVERMSIEELQNEIAKMRKEKSHLHKDILSLQMTIEELRKAKTEIIEDYSQTRIEYDAKRGEVERGKQELESKKIELQGLIDRVERQKIDCREKELEIAKRYSEIKVRFENQEREFERLKKSAVARKDQLNSSWAEFLQTTARGNKVFSQLIAGVPAQQLLLTELAAYGSCLSEKENAVFTNKIFKWGSDWQNHPLKRAYALVYVGEIQCKNVGEEELMTIQALFALDVNGKRELLAILDEECLSEQLVASFSELRSRHVREIYLICLPNSEDLQLTLQKSYPDSEICFFSFE